MSYERITPTSCLCTCAHVDCKKHTKPWVSRGPDPPNRCSGCKRTTWQDGVDKRRGSFTRVRKGSKK